MLTGQLALSRRQNVDRRQVGVNSHDIEQKEHLKRLPEHTGFPKLSKRLQ